jgi:hypothetical protein
MGRNSSNWGAARSFAVDFSARVSMTIIYPYAQEYGLSAPACVGDYVYISVFAECIVSSAGE